jgi:hypothetical protein
VGELPRELEDPRGAERGHPDPARRTPLGSAQWCLPAPVALGVAVLVGARPSCSAVGDSALPSRLLAAAVPVLLSSARRMVGGWGEEEDGRVRNKRSQGSFCNCLPC